MNRNWGRAILISLLTASLGLIAAPAFAQGRQSFGAGDMAVTGSLGFANAFDDDFDGFEIHMNGSFEYYTSQNISWRGMLGLVEFDARINGRNNTAEFTFIDANIVYTWDTAGTRPFVTGGIGVYDKDASGPDVPPGFGDTDLGINFGGGIEIPVADQWAIKVEGLFHGVSGDGPDSFFAATGGVKFWF